MAILSAFDAANRLFQWTAPPGSAGTSTQLVFRVHDGESCQAGSHSVPVQFTVHAAEAPFAMAEAPQNANEQVIRWSTIPGQVYEIEYTDDLKSGVWELLATITAVHVETAFTDFNNVAPQLRYYRVRWLR